MLLLPLQRHDLVFLKTIDEACSITPVTESPWVINWHKTGRPFWVTRQSDTTQCVLGVSLYTAGDKKRISISVPWSYIKNYQAPPLLKNVVKYVPPSWQEPLNTVIRLAEQYHIIVRVFGAAAYAPLLAHDLFREKSDVDLLFVPSKRSQVDGFLAELIELTRVYPKPMIDGEIRWLDTDVPWREYAEIKFKQCLVKSINEVKLVERSSLASRVGQERIRLAKITLTALYDELRLCPKPGLVNPLDTGSHHDMDMHLLWRSVFALRHYFLAIIDLGQQQAPFDKLREQGIVAENKMLARTAGVNTHRGGIFHLGLLLAARASQPATTAQKICARILELWGEELTRHQMQTRALNSHGQLVFKQWHRPGALEMALSGYAFVVNDALPFYRQALAQDHEFYARSRTLLFLIAYVDDSTILWRGGEGALMAVQEEARYILKMGPMTNSKVWARWLAFHYRMINNKLSPGGSADLLAFIMALNNYATDSDVHSQTGSMNTRELLCV
ncbi:MAG: malonate decarboxylase holo-[acyl-carrier-protein] synthase [Betaproteobacteria bacterium]|nr:malonate decarboxylase holo-[acyl-carrier-protein] synthase [Betaproteobacteria bacterium]